MENQLLRVILAATKQGKTVSFVQMNNKELLVSVTKQIKGKTTCAQTHLSLKEMEEEKVDLELSIAQLNSV